MKSEHEIHFKTKFYWKLKQKLAEKKINKK